MTKFKFTTKPWAHQLAALEYLFSRSFGALYTDMGSGKTKVLIDLIINKGFKRTIIVATNKVCTRQVWDKEILKHAPSAQIMVINLAGIDSDKKVRHLSYLRTETKLDQEVLIVNYEGIWREPFKTFLLNKYKPDCVICDESHRIKSAGSKVSRFLTRLGKITPNRYVMTGTPLAQSPLDIYAQYRFLQPSIFGTNFGDFSRQYANWISMPGGYSILDKNKPYKNLDELHEKMFSCAFDCKVDQNLPPTQDIILEFEMPPQTQKYYAELKKEGCLELEQGDLETGNVLGIMTRLQQLTSGYLPLSVDGKKTVTEIDTARQTALREWLEDIPEQEPIVVFAKFTKDIKNIRKTAESIGRKTSELSGHEDTLQDWVDDKTKVLVIQISAGAEGLNELVKAKYCLYYTHHHSLMLYKQSRKRLHRPGQLRPVIFYTLVAKLKKGKTIDELILEGLKANQEIIELVMGDLARKTP